MTNSKYITISDFNRMWGVGPGRAYRYWNPERAARFKHAGVRWQREHVEHLAGLDTSPIALLNTRRGVVVVAGCRRLTFDEAEAHWMTPADIGGGLAQRRAAFMLDLLPKLKRRARRYGWKVKEAS